MIAVMIVISILLLPLKSFAVDLPVNTWVRITPTVSLLPGETGKYRNRGWGELVYVPATGKTYIYQGYEDPTHSYTIYSNCVWSLDPVSLTIQMEKLSNWTGDKGSITSIEPDQTNDPTPMNRHPYSQMAYVGEKNAIYMWGGANQTSDPNWETWKFSLTTKTWSQIIPGPAPTYNSPWAGLEKAMVYDEFNRKLVVGPGVETEKYGPWRSAAMFDIDTESWSFVDTAVKPAPMVGSTMVYDPIRKRCLMFGGGTGYPVVAWNELWSFDAAKKTWTKLTPSGIAPSGRRFSGLAYDSRRDIFIIYGGNNGESKYNDTFVYYPAENRWGPLNIGNPPDRPTDLHSADFVYDSKNDVFILQESSGWYMMKLDLENIVIDSIAPIAPSFR